MRLVPTVLAAGLLATAAHAATPADGEQILSCTAPEGEEAVCPVDLVKGHDYALVSGKDDGFGYAELINPQGVATVRYGGEFRAAYTATYHVRVRNDDGFYARLATDCRADVKTLCTIAPGQARTVDSLFRRDDDWLRLAARKGRTYTFVVEGTGYTEARLYDKAGRRVAAGHSSNTSGTVTLRYKARYAGAYYVSANSHGGNVVTLK